MGRLISGINGPIRGKVGTVIGSSRNGVPYVKGPYKKRTENVSERELLNRKKFAAAQAWLAPLLGFVREGFRNYSPRSQGFIAAKSYLLKNALKVEGNEVTIDPSLVKLSFGNLPNADHLTVDIAEPGLFRFSWDPSKNGDIDNDLIMMLAYDVENSYASGITTGQFRKVGSDTLAVNLAKGKVFYLYAAFNASDRSRQSESMYLGEFKF